MNERNGDITPTPSFENIRHIYFVAAHKLILNVSKIRLRLICARASYLYRLFSKALEKQKRYGCRRYPPQKEIL